VRCGSVGERKRCQRNGHDKRGCFEGRGSTSDCVGAKSHDTRGIPVLRRVMTNTVSPVAIPRDDGG
jgi:hypothetical protein